MITEADVIFLKFNEIYHRELRAIVRDAVKSHGGFSSAAQALKCDLESLRDLHDALISSLDLGSRFKKAAEGGHLEGKALLALSPEDVRGKTLRELKDIIGGSIINNFKISFTENFKISFKGQDRKPMSVEHISKFVGIDEFTAIYFRNPKTDIGSLQFDKPQEYEDDPDPKLDQELETRQKEFLKEEQDFFQKPEQKTLTENARAILASIQELPSFIEEAYDDYFDPRYLHSLQKIYEFRIKKENAEPLEREEESLLELPDHTLEELAQGFRSLAACEPKAQSYSWQINQIVASLQTMREEEPAQNAPEIAPSPELL